MSRMTRRPLITYQFRTACTSARCAINPTIQVRTASRPCISPNTCSTYSTSSVNRSGQAAQFSSTLPVVQCRRNAASTSLRSTSTTVLSYDVGLVEATGGDRGDPDHAFAVRRRELFGFGLRSEQHREARVITGSGQPQLLPRSRGAADVTRPTFVTQ